MLNWRSNWLDFYSHGVATEPENTRTAAGARVVTVVVPAVQFTAFASF